MIHSREAASPTWLGYLALLHTIVQLRTFNVKV